MAAKSAFPRGRELHLIDVENLLGTPYFTTTAVRGLRASYGRIIGTAGVALQVVGTSTSANLLTAALGWDGARPVFEKGTNGADRALLAAGEFNPERRFDRVVIASGDHAFAPYAALLQQKGVTVTVVCRRNSLSHHLRLAVTDIRYLPHPKTEPGIDFIPRQSSRLAANLPTA